ncbi:hypothetical protein FGB62_5g541 [Gracilaria domingensis]|nr:hypothetical protein FGB62_5g541 [Gracilaria domingensis]
MGAGGRRGEVEPAAAVIGEALGGGGRSMKVGGEAGAGTRDGEAALKCARRQRRGGVGRRDMISTAGAAAAAACDAL